MAFVHERDRQVHFKIVYAGPARGGKTTNLLSLYARLPADKRGRLLSLAGPEERTLFFDFLPFHLGEVGGLDTRFHLYTVPGQARHRRSRQTVLRGADAVVFVIDSAPHRRLAVEGAWRELLEPGFLDGRPAWIVQYNKRDLPDAVTVEELRRIPTAPVLAEVEAVATRGEGVYDTLRHACRAALARFTQPALR